MTVGGWDVPQDARECRDARICDEKNVRWMGDDNRKIEKEFIWVFVVFLI